MIHVDELLRHRWYAQVLEKSHTACQNLKYACSIVGLTHCKHACDITSCCTDCSLIENLYFTISMVARKINDKTYKNEKINN